MFSVGLPKSTKEFSGKNFETGARLTFPSQGGQVTHISLVYLGHITEDKR